LGGLYGGNIVLEVDGHVGASVLQVQRLGTGTTEVRVDTEQKRSNAIGTWGQVFGLDLNNVRWPLGLYDEEDKLTAPPVAIGPGAYSVAVPVTSGGGAVGDARVQDAPRAMTTQVRSLENMSRRKTVFELHE
jgi:hypothetical protein